MNTPVGIDEIISTFGNIHNYIENGLLLPTWQEEYMAMASLPFPIPLSWNHDVSVTHIQCHKLMVPVFTDVFSGIVTSNMQDSIKEFGGCFSFRPQRTGTILSTHSWGIAIDLNPTTNQQGTDGDMDQGIVRIFRDNGFVWGGDWVGKSKDPMHFQMASGY